MQSGGPLTVFGNDVDIFYNALILKSQLFGAGE
jgi:hypothetical protein